MNWPAFFSRKYRFVSICARNSDRGVSSTDERLPYPALLTTTSSEPNTSTAAITAFAAAASSVTSIAKSLTRSPYSSERSASDLMSRAVANTLLPAARPASTIARPRPRELPVTNHTCAIHPPLSSNPPDILEKLLKLRIGCAMGIRKDLLVTEEIRRIFRPLRSAIVRRRKESGSPWFQSWLPSPPRGCDWESGTSGVRLQKRPRQRWSLEVMRPHREPSRDGQALP